MKAAVSIKLAIALSILLCSIVMSVQAQSFPPASQHIADCEGKWILHEHSKSDDLRALGYVYVDPSVGFTIEAHGDVGLDPNGALLRVEDPLEGKARLIIRVESNSPVACLSDEVVTKLGLPREWQFKDNYADKRPAGLHYTEWSRHYNHIGAFQQALDFAMLARAKKYVDARLEFEHGFALNALQRCQEAEQVLVAAHRRYAQDVEITAELAYAHLCLGEYARAIEIYEQALKDDKKKASTRRSEFAQNIANAYASQGDDAKALEWSEKAEAWRGEK